MDGKFFLYRVLRALVMVFYGVFKPFRIVNRENIPEGAAVICANHTGLTDPFYMAFAVPPTSRMPTVKASRLKGMVSSAE